MTREEIICEIIKAGGIVVKKEMMTPDMMVVVVSGPMPKVNWHMFKETEFDMGFDFGSPLKNNLTVVFWEK